MLALIDVPPRMRICAPAPGSPLFSVTFTPATRALEELALALVMTPTFASVGVDRGDRAGDRLAALRAVARHDDGAEVRGHGGEGDLDRASLPRR